MKGLPIGAVQNAIQRDGLDPSIMELDPDKSIKSQLNMEKDNGPPLKDDPEYSKYFRMLSMVSRVQRVIKLYPWVYVMYCTYPQIYNLVVSGTADWCCSKCNDT